MADLQKLIVDMEARTARFDAGMKKAQRSTRRTERGLSQLNKTAKTLNRGLASLGAALTFRGIASSIQNLANMASEAQHAADTIGVNVETLQKYRAAAADVGISARTTDVALRRFTRRLGEAQRGTGELAPTIEQLGLELRRSDGTLKSMEEVLLEFSDAISEADGQTQKLALTFKGFDSEGAPFVQVIGHGREETERLTEAVLEQGRVLEEQYSKAIERTTTRLGAHWDSFITSWQTRFGQAIQLLEVFTGEERIVRIEKIAPALDSVADATARVTTKLTEAEKASAALQTRLDAQRNLIRESNNETQFFENVSLLNEAYAEGAINIDVYNQRFELLKRKFEETPEDVKEMADAVEKVDGALSDMGSTITDEVSGTLADLATGGKVTFRDFANAIIRDVIRMTVTMTTLKAVMSGIQGLFGGPTAGAGGLAAGTGLLRNADGNAFQGGNVIPFARGGVVSQPTFFPMRNGAGVMSEFGQPEAIMPLVRRGGVLGVQGGGGSTFAPSITVNMNAGSDGDGAAIGREVARAVKGAWASMAQDQKRVGGVLNPVR